MRYRKGSKVEVLSRQEMLSGGWCPAEIVIGNGRNYTVRYDMPPDAAFGTERLPRKAIRPVPPPSNISEPWAPGDVVEVFENFSWKTARIVKFLGNDCFLVQLLVSPVCFQVGKFDLRVQQLWKDDRWIFSGKGSESFVESKDNGNPISKYDAKLNSQMQNKKLKIKFSLRDDQLPLEAKRNVKKCHTTFSKSLRKRSYPQVEEAYTGTPLKFRIVESDGRYERIVAADSPVLLKQVDAVASTRNLLDEKSVHGSTKISAARCFHSDIGWDRRDAAAGCSLAQNFASNESDSISSSVGSCSIGSDGFYELPHSSSFGAVGNADDHSSDAESCCWSRGSKRRCLIPAKEDMAAEIHRLELHAYRCTIEILHASGPLSWEQEAMITNLRMSLNISNEEHLMEIKNLISIDKSISIK